MSQYYVPAIPSANDVVQGRMPHTAPLKKYPHFDREKQAQAYVNQNPGRSIFQGKDGNQVPMRYGPKDKTLMWPKVEMIYRVEVERPDKLQALQESEKTYSGLGKAGETTLDPSHVLSRGVTIYTDDLHKTPYTPPHDEPVIDKHINNDHIIKEMRQRGEDLQRMYDILARSSPAERRMLDMENPEHEKMMRDVCVHTPAKDSLEDKTLLMVQRQIAERTGIQTVLSMNAIQAEFASRLESLPPDTPAAERVAIAMEGTLAKFTQTIPAHDRNAVSSVSANVRGIIHEAEAEMDSQDISVHELGADDAERVLHQTLNRIPEEDREEFERIYNQECQRLDIQHNFNQMVALHAALEYMRQLHAQLGNEEIAAMYREIQEGIEQEFQAHYEDHEEMAEDEQELEN